MMRDGWARFAFEGNGRRARRLAALVVLGLVAGVLSLAAVVVPAPAPAGALVPAGVTPVATGVAHTCALTPTSGVVCWGSGFAGALGNGSSADAATPVAVTGLASGVTAVGAGSSFSCALLATGAVKCWGFNGYGQLGNGSTGTTSSTPVDVSGISDAVTMSVAANSACVVHASGGVSCWGDGQYGQLGDGAMIASSTPVRVADITAGATSVSVGTATACAVVDGAATCWGSNNAGQVGDGSSATIQPTPVLVSGLSSGVAAVRVGDTSACAVTTSGGAKCWGNNLSGKLGDGTTVSSLVPVDVVGLPSGVRSIVTGTNYSCALLIDGGVTCWGSIRPISGATAPTTVPGISGASFLAGSNTSACVLSGSGVGCFGELGSRAGNGRLGFATTPIDVPALTSGVTAISAGGTNSSRACAVVSGGAKCWGANTSGQLGTGTLTDGPTDVTGLTSGVTAISAGATSSCAVVSGAAKCWGGNTSGQLGNGTTTASKTPIDVSGLGSGVTSVSVGLNHACAVVSGGAKCWGSNTSGQLGNGTTTASTNPVDVTGLTSGVVAIGAGAAHSCAQLTTGAVRCWGVNGRLGNAAGTGSTTPVAAGSLTGTTGLTVGGQHSCTILSTGAARCWGSSTYGQVGSSSAVTPTQVTGLTSGVTSISAGAEHTCAVVSGGVKCWGRGSLGQLGNGTTTPSTSTPQNVTGLSSGASSVAAGNSVSCAITTAGAAKCWGSDDSGLLGQPAVTWASGGAAAFYPAPVTAPVGVGASHDVRRGPAHAVTFQLSASDPDGDVIDGSVPQSGFSKLTDPAVGTLSCTAAGSCTYSVPSDATPGSYSFTWRVKDQLATSTSVTETLVVTNAAPVASAVAVSADRGVATPITLSASDADGDSLTYAVATDPAQGTVSCTASSCTYTSTPSASGTDTFTYTASDDVATSDPATVTITLPSDGGGSGPTTPGFGTVGSPLPVTYAQWLDTDVLAGSTGDGVTLDSFTQGSHGTVTDESGLLRYTPTGEVLGADSFTYTLEDAHGQTVTGIVSVTVQAPAAPTAGSGGSGSGTGSADAPFTTPFQTPISIPALASSAGYHLVVSATTDGTHGTVAVASGDPVYTPADGWAGLDTFTYTVSDPFGQTDTATAYVRTELPDAPVAAGSSKTVQAPGALTVSAPGVLDGATGTGTSITGHTSPAHGTLSLDEGTGAYTYTPALGYAGPDSFTYTITDAFSRPATGTVSLTVEAPTAPTVVADQYGTTPYGTALIVAAPGVLDGSTGTALRVTDHTDPGHGTLTIGGDGGYAYTPASGFVGEDAFTATISDPYGQSAVVTVHLTVALPAGPVLVGSSVTVDLDTAKAVPAPGVLAGSSGTGLSAALADPPSHGSVTVLPDGSYTYTPASGYVGPDSFTVTGADGFGRTSSPATVAVDVVPATTTATLSVAPNPSAFGQALVLTATVTAPSGTPSGTVTFLDGATTLGTATVVSGHATLTTTALAVGSHDLTATFASSGGAHRTSTSEAVTQVVEPASTTTAVVSDANPAPVGQAITLTATVTGAGGTPTGTVAFLDGTTTLGTRTLDGNGRATLTTSALTAGSHPITVTYAPAGGGYLGSTSTVLPQVVTRPYSVTSSNTSTFNSSIIGAGRTIWFDPVAKVRNLGSTAVTIKVTDASVTYGTTTVPVPDTWVTFDPLATKATTTYDATNGRWITTVPSAIAASSNTMVGGIPIRTPSSIPGGLTPVTWRATFSTTTAGVDIDWKWAAATYTTFNTNLAGIGVKPVDDKASSSYANSDLAGTPEGYKTYVVAGAKGLGGTNYTGTFGPVTTIRPV